MVNVLKTTACIERTHADNIIAASIHAKHFGMNLNTAVTIHWALAGGVGTWRERRATLFERVRHWLSRQGAPWTAVWVSETGQLGKDVHSHLACHLPRHISLADFESYLRKQLATEETRVLVVKPIAGPFGLAGWRKYMLKALPSDLHAAYGIPNRENFKQSQGLVLGKRCGITQNIGPTARKRRMEDNLTKPDIAA